MAGMDDRQQIVEALAWFAAGLDKRDWDALRGMLAPDVIAYGAEGPDAVIEKIRAHLGGCGPSQHLLGNHRIEVDGDAARALTYARVYHEGAGEYAGKFYECLGEYEDRWTRTAEGWLLSRRKFTFSVQLGDFGVLQPG